MGYRVAFTLLLLVCTAAGTACGQSLSGSSFAGRVRPNVVLMILDDLSKDDLYIGGLYSTTPNLDALATAGVKWRTMWAMPVCGATRTTLHTGQNYLRTGITGPFATNAGRYETFLNKLRDSGIQVGVFGKGGMGGTTLATQSWAGLGATRYVGHLSPAVPDHEAWDLIDATISRQGLTLSATETALSVGSPTTIYDTYNTGYYSGDVTTSAALLGIAEFEAAQPGKPWFIEVSYPAPAHSPLQAAPGDSCTGADCVDSMVEYWDDQLQAIVDAVDLNHTVFFVLSDNGPNVRPSDVRGCKQKAHECGVSVAMFAFGGGIAAAADIGGLHSVADLAITIPQLLGAAVPAGAVDGCSLMPELFPSGGWTGCTHEFLYATASGVETLRRADGYKLDIIAAGDDEMYKVDNTGFGEDEGANLCTGACPGGLGGADLTAYNALKAEYDSL